MRKPKYHPEYGTRLVGINFRERWNVVLFATKEELETFCINDKYMRDHHWSKFESWWKHKEAVANQNVQNLYFRKLWRQRHSQSFVYDTLYRVDRNIQRWNTKLGPSTGDGIASSYNFDRSRKQLLNKDDLLVFVKRDEMGNVYFNKIDDITAPYPYVFNRDNKQLGYIVPVSS